MQDVPDKQGKDKQSRMWRWKVGLNASHVEEEGRA